MPIPEKRTLASPGHRPSGLGPRAPTPARRPLPSTDSLTGALSTSPLPEPGSHLRHSQNRSSSSRTAPTRCQGGACAETARRLASISVASVSGSVWFGSTQAESAPPPRDPRAGKAPLGVAREGPESEPGFSLRALWGPFRAAWGGWRWPGPFREHPGRGLQLVGCERPWAGPRPSVCPSVRLSVWRSVSAASPGLTVTPVPASLRPDPPRSCPLSSRSA